MIHSGQPAHDFIDHATRHVLLRQGVLGIKVKIMRGSDPEGKNGPTQTLPDAVQIMEPKEEAPVEQPSSKDYNEKLAATQRSAELARQEQEQGQEGQQQGGDYEES
jgi:small subunit ribosomal protein S3e